MRRSAEMKTSCEISSERPWSPDHAVDVGGDTAAITVVELLERAVVARAHGSYEVIIPRFGGDSPWLYAVSVAVILPVLVPIVRDRAPVHAGRTLAGNGRRCKAIVPVRTRIEFGPMAASGTYRGSRRAARARRIRRLRAERPPGSGQARTSATVVTGVSAHLELFERALARRRRPGARTSRALLGQAPARARRPRRARLRLLLESEISLAAYHLPLDGHPWSATTRCIAGGARLRRRRAVRAVRAARSASRRVRGRRHRRRRSGRARAQTLTGGREPLVFADGTDGCASLGIVSGAGADHLPDAIARGLDAFLTGEPAERVMAAGARGRIHFIAAGHYATETFGVQRARRPAGRALRHAPRLLDVPNPIADRQGSGACHRMFVRDVERIRQALYLNSHHGGRSDGKSPDAH